MRSPRRHGHHSCSPVPGHCGCCRDGNCRHRSRGCDPGHSAARGEAQGGEQTRARAAGNEPSDTPGMKREPRCAGGAGGVGDPGPRTGPGRRPRRGRSLAPAGRSLAPGGRSLAPGGRSRAAIRRWRAVGLRSRPAARCRSAPQRQFLLRHSHGGADGESLPAGQGGGGPRDPPLRPAAACPLPAHPRPRRRALPGAAAGRAAARLPHALQG